MLEENINTTSYTLIITTICGGGHLQAANAIRKKILSSDQTAQVIQIDLFNDWMGKAVGGFLTRCWNSPLRKGHNILSLCYSYFGIPFADPLFFIPLFINAFKTFQKYPLCRVIDTQPVGSFAITLALLLSNKLKNKNLKIEKILTELPTKKAIHFFHPLKLLPKCLTNLIEFHVVEPLPLEKNFWPKYTGLKACQIKKMDPPLREDFFGINKFAFGQDYLELTFFSAEQKEKCLLIARLNNWIETKDKGLTVLLKPDTDCHITTLMLGSQPQIKTIRKYLVKFKELCTLSSEKHHLFFILGNHNLSKWNDLVTEWAEKQGLPENFHPVLLSVQNNKTIAQLLKSSHHTITR